MAFIDPHRTTVHGQETSPAGTKKKLSKVFEHEGDAALFHNIFGCDKNESQYDHTLFRFPLRQHDNQSKISTNTNSVEYIKSTHFQSLKCEAPFLLLFLNNVKKISLYDMNLPFDTTKLLFSVTIENRCQQLLKMCQRSLQQELNSPLKSSAHLDCASVFTHDACTEVNEEYHWLIMNVIGCDDDEVNTLSKDLSILPWVGLAAQIPTPVNVHNECFSKNLMETISTLLSNVESSAFSCEENCKLNTSGQAFCFLPLPIHTALPIHIHGYFAVSDNRRGIKWPDHDEQSPEALWNKALICRLIAPAYAALLSSKCALSSFSEFSMAIDYKVRNMLSAGYSSWPSYNEIKNSQMWLEVLQPMLSCMKDSHVLWTTAEGGKWVNFTKAYFVHDADPTIVVTTLLKGGLPIVILPDSVYTTITTSDCLNEVLKSKIISPHILRKHFPDGSRFTSDEVHVLLEYILSDLDDSNFSEIFSIPLLPLQNGVCCSFEACGSCDDKYLLSATLKPYYHDIFPGIGHMIVDTALPISLERCIEKIASRRFTQINLANCKDVQFLFKASISTWLSLNQHKSCSTWCPGKDNHPTHLWLKSVWEWITKERIALDTIVGLPLIPKRSFDDETFHLVCVESGGCFCRLQQSMNKKKWCSMFEKLDIVIVEDTITGPFFPELNQKSVLDKLSMLDSHSLNAMIVRNLNVKQRELLRDFCSRRGYHPKGEHIKCLRNLPIFCDSSLTSKLVALDDPNKPFLPPTNVKWHSALSCPKGMLCNKDQQVVKLIQDIGTKPISFSDFCIKQLIPLINGLIHNHATCDHGDNIVLWVLSEISQISGNSTDAKHVLNHLSEENLIRTKNGDYKRAKDLYNDEHKFKILFNDVSDVTPDDKYQPHLHLLKKMGLRCWSGIKSSRTQLKNTLSHSMHSIGKINSLGDKIRRGQFILDEIFKSDLTEDDKKELSCFGFLCAKKRPPNYPKALKWYTSSDHRLYSIQSLYSNSSRSSLIGAVQPIISEEYDVPRAAKRYFKSLVVEDIRDQLELIETSNFTLSDVKEVSDVVENIYKDLLKFKINEKLKRVWVPVLSPPQFIDCNKFVISTPFPLEPYIYELTYHHFKNLWHIKPTILVDDALEILSMLKLKCDGSTLNDSELKMSANLVQWLYENEADSHCCVLLPTVESELATVQDCVYDDRDWSKKIQFPSTFQGKKFVNSYLISSTIAKYFNVQPLSFVVAPSSNLAIEYTRSGQYESITNRIKRIVEDYNDDIDIFKELIQNADDAGATEIKFLIDWRTHPISSLFCEEMKPWQGPALLVYNNATFSNQDLENICKVAGETKMKDPMKTGRFGLGFCATYHMTDLPSFVTGKFLMIFDPHTNYLRDRVTSSKPGMKINLVDTQANLSYYEDQFLPYNNMFECDIFNLTETGYEGTLFRFPFRNSVTSGHSSISAKVYGEKEVLSLVHSLEDTSHEIMLFQKHINLISVFEIKQGSSSKDELFCVSKRCEDTKSRINLLRREHVSVDTPTSCSTTCVINPSRGSKSSWIMCSVMNTSGQNKELLKESKANGVLPFGEIALQVSGEGISKHPEKVEGKIFCFLPLPISNGLTFHVNAHFHVSKDRRNLSLASNDSFGTQWNTFLSKEVHSHAFVRILKEYINNVDMTSCTVEERETFLKSYYQLWHFYISLPTSIAPKIIDGINVLLKSTCFKLLWSESNGGMWLSIKAAILFVDEKVRREVLDDVFNVMLKLNYKLIRVPSHVITLIQDNVDHVYNYEQFVSDVLFPLINHDQFRIIWERSLLYMLNQISLWHNSFGWAERLLKSKLCIPCQHSSSLKKIEDLIDCTQKLLAQIYETSEGYFPIKTLLDSPEVKASLIKLGMSSHHLTSMQLADRARSVVKITPLDSALHRSTKLIEYIEETYSHTYHYRMNPSDLECLSDIPFLPVCKKPSQVQLPWFGDNCVFCSPCEAYTESELFLVFTKAKITPDSAGRGQLFFQVKKNPPFQLVVQHLKNIIDFTSGRFNEETKKYLGEVMMKIYSYLNTELQHGCDCAEELHLIQTPIWQDGVFKSATKVIKGCDVSCHPYVTRLSEVYSKFDQLFIRVLGVKTELTVDIMVSILKDVHSDFPSDLPDNVLKFVNEIAVKVANEISIRGNLSEDIFLPDCANIMRPVHQLACDNFKNDWVKTLPTYREHFESGHGYFVHPDIPRDKAVTLGVRPLLDAVIQEIEDDTFLDGFDYGQHENLCVRLNSILSKYPADASILQEFIQNADDAQASEIVFILDHRTNHPDKTLLCGNENWKSLQHTPALCIINNRNFSEQDIKGISDLGRGAKSEFVQKIGKFGIGFNVAYHVTDCPSFLSCGQNGVPENLCVFDPTLSYVHKRGKKLPGRRWILSSEHITDFEDQFRPYLLNDVMKIGSKVLTDINDTGYVIFRLPLTRKKSKDAKLYNGEKFTTADIEKLFNVFMDSSKEVLLFLNNIKSISAIEIKEDGQYVHCFTTSSTIPSYFTSDCIHFLKQSAECTAQLVSGNSSRSLSLFHRIDIGQQVSDEEGTEKSSSESWLVQKAMCGNFECDHLHLAMKHNLRAVGGVAALLCPDQHKQHKLFCYLPTPLKIPLPVHINGHFVVDDSRKHLETMHIFGENLPDWNFLLVEKVIIPTYIKLIQNSRTYYLDHPHLNIEVDKYLYRLFPETKVCSSSSYGVMLSSARLILPEKLGNLNDLNVISLTFYKQMKECNSQLMLIKGEKQIWIPIKDAIFCLHTSSQLITVLLALGMKIVDCPHIYEGFNAVKTGYRSLNQSLVVSHLSSIDAQIHEVKTIIRDNVECLIHFCIQQVKKKRVASVLNCVPLLLCADGSLQKRSRVFHFRYSSLLPNCLNSIVDQKLESSGIGGRLSDCGVIIYPDLEFIAHHIDILDSPVACMLDSKCMEVIKLLWSFLRERENHILIEGKNLKSAFRLKPILPTTNGKMYPFCLSKMVIGNPDRPISDLLLKFGYDKIDFDIIGLNNSESMLYRIIEMVTFSRTEDFLSCFELGEPPKYNVEISEDDMKLLTRSLCTYDTKKLSSIASVLSKLKMFRHADDKRFVSLDSECCVCIVPSELPKDGLDILQSLLTAFIFLKKPETSSEILYESVIPNYKSTFINVTDMYLDHILPNLAHLRGPDVLTHMDYIRSNASLKSECFLNELRRTPFVECNGKLVLTEDLYDPRNEFFKAFRKDCLPNEDWWKEERVLFLCELGLCTTVSTMEWISQAKRFTTSCPIFSDAPKMSNTLYNELCHIINKYKEDSTIESFLTEVSEIPFLHSTSNCVYMLCFKKAFNLQYDPNVWVKFSQSVSHYDASLAFVLRSVLPYKCNKLITIPKIRNALKVENPINTETVIEHLQCVCEASSSYFSLSEGSDLKKQLIRIFNDHYAYFDKIKLKPENIAVLKDLACIVFDVGDGLIKMVKVTQVVEQLPSMCDLEPFCYRLPSEIAQHTNFTTALGIKKEFTAEDFGRILDDVYRATEGKLQRDETTVAVARCAYHELIRCLRLQSCDTLGEKYDGFLLSEEYTMFRSTDMYYNDVPWYAQRFPKNRFKYILIPLPDEQGSRDPPRSLNVSFLSEVVKEKINDDCRSPDTVCNEDMLYHQQKRENRCVYADKIATTLSSSQFVEGMCRIYFADHQCSPPESFQKIVHTFGGYEIVCLQMQLTTQLFHDDTIIPGSQDSSQSCILSRDEGILFIHPHSQNFDIKTLLKHISSQLNLALGYVIKNEQNIATLFECDPKDISFLLTQNRIPEHFLNEVQKKSGDFHKVGTSLCLSTLCARDALIIVNFRKEEKVKYYSPTGELLYAKVTESCTDLKGRNITSRYIEITTTDSKGESDEKNVKMQSILVSPLEIFKILTMPQIKSLKENKPSLLASPLVLAAIPCENVAQIKHWCKEIFNSENVLMYSGLLISLIKVRLIAHLHYHLLSKKIAPDIFKHAVFEIMHFVANEQLPFSPICQNSKLYKKLDDLSRDMEQLFLGDDDDSDGSSSDDDNDNVSHVDNSSYIFQTKQKRESEVSKNLSTKSPSKTDYSRYQLDLDECSRRSHSPTSQSSTVSKTTNTSSHSSSSRKSTGTVTSHPAHHAAAAPTIGTVHSRFSTQQHSRSHVPQRNQSRFNHAEIVVQPVKEPPMCKEKARAWLEQAKVDYKAAQSFLRISETDEGNSNPSTVQCHFPALVCFLCHDIVEKCLKGLLYVYAEDNKFSINCSNLVTLMQQLKTSATKDTDLHKVCNETVMVVSMYENKSRYPSFHNPPCAPAAVYLDTDAREAFSAVSSLMTKLEAIQLLSDIIGRLDVVPKPKFISSMKSTTAECKWKNYL